MKIVLTTTIYPPDIGGPATYSQEIKERLMERGYTIKILTTSSTAQEELNVHVIKKKSNIKILGFFIHHFRIFFSLISLSKDVDVIYTLDPKFLGFNSIISGWIVRKPVILRFGGDRVWENAFNRGLTVERPEDYFNNLQGGIYPKYLFSLQKWVMKHSQKIIVPSNNMKRITTKFYQTVS